MTIPRLLQIRRLLLGLLTLIEDELVERGALQRERLTDRAMQARNYQQSQ